MYATDGLLCDTTVTEADRFGFIEKLLLPSILHFLTPQSWHRHSMEYFSRRRFRFPLVIRGFLV